MNNRGADEESAEKRVASFGALGAIEAWDDGGNPVRFTRGLQRVLAILLENANEVVRDDVLLDRLWPEEDPRSALKILQTNIWSLKRLFGQDEGNPTTPFLGRRDAGYELRLEVKQLDWYRYQRLRAGAARAISRTRPAEAKALLLDARRLWRGDPVVGLTGDLFSTPFVRHLEAARADVELQLIDVGLALGQHHELIPQLRHLTGRNPDDEALARFLMLALFRAGRQAEALDVYYTCRKRLVDSGLSPTPALSATQMDILTHAAGAVAPATPARTSSGLGLSGTVLVGRWPPGTPPTWAQGDAELILCAEDEGGELVEADAWSLVARFDDVDRALAAAVAIQDGLKCRQTTLGRFVVHDGSRAASRGVRLLDLCRTLLADAAAGQILVFRSADQEEERRLAEGAELRELGEHHVPGSDPAIRLFQLMAPQFAGSARAFTPVAPPPKHNLPVFGNQMIGREALVEDIALHLPRGRLLTLTGTGGVGKTRLAVEAARSLVGEYADGTWFVELEWLTDPALIAGTVADVIGLDRSRSVPAVEVLMREMATRHALLVLDTCEHLLSPARAFVDRLLSACPFVSVIVTTLQPLGSDQEEVIRVPPLETPPAGRLPPADLRESASVRLFYDHLGSTPVADADAEVVGEICRLVDGIPLTIALAAARTTQLGPTELARELRRTFADGGALRLLDAGGRLRQTLAWSFSLLDDAEGQALAAFSLFAGTFGLDEARELCSGSTEADVAATLCVLANCSAVVVEAGTAVTPTYRLLQPVRAFASIRLDDDPVERARLSRRHAEMYLRRAQQADRAFGGPDEDAELLRMDVCLQNVRAALRWSLAAEDAPLALGLAGSLWRYWFSRGHLAEGLKASTDALALESEPSPIGTRALGGSSYLAWWTGDLQYTRKTAEETASRAEATGDPWGLAWAPLGLAAVSMFTAESAPPGADLHPAIEYFVGAGLPWEAGQALQLLAGQEWYRENYPAACQHYGEALELSRAAGSQTFMDSLQGHGLMLALMGRIDEGVREIQAGLELADRRRDPVGICHALTYRAAIAAYDQDLDEAAQLYALALRVAADTGEIWIVQWAIGGLAAWIAPSRAQEAARLLGQVDGLAEATGIRLAPRERAAHAAAMHEVLSKRGAAAQRALMEGRTMGLDAAVELALSLGA